MCVGQTATLSANGASTYTWSTSETINSISVSPTVSTTYTLTGNSVLDVQMRLLSSKC
ncbi:MAG: hypothetical protein IPH32_19105 [Bacteroidetes bacterium]|nr:hypothetical protein [Bacteroidota bacterium]